MTCYANDFIYCITLFKYYLSLLQYPKWKLSRRVKASPSVIIGATYGWTCPLLLLSNSVWWCHPARYDEESFLRLLHSIHSCEHLQQPVHRNLYFYCSPAHNCASNSPVLKILGSVFGSRVITLVESSLKSGHFLSTYSCPATIYPQDGCN